MVGTGLTQPQEGRRGLWDLDSQPDVKGGGRHVILIDTGPILRTPQFKTIFTASL